MIMHEVAVTELDGTKKIFRSVQKAAEYYGKSSTAITNRILGKVSTDPRKFEYTGKTFVGGRINKRNEKDEEDDTPCKLKRHEVPYETIGTRVCVTLCQHRNGVKVGSLKCQTCNRFREIQRDKHIVICG